MWEEVPDADALLDARLARGWVAVPSPMASGPQVLGFAASRGGGSAAEGGE